MIVSSANIITMAINNIPIHYNMSRTATDDQLRRHFVRLAVGSDNNRPYWLFRFPISSGDVVVAIMRYFRNE